MIIFKKEMSIFQFLNGSFFSQTCHPDEGRISLSFNNYV
ncbi:hypothetical protein RCH33_1427 [Flavobacterium daejeonense]|nr:hypothetical protein RCH33_1427 [Flavobacterium daejeonense]